MKKIFCRNACIFRDWYNHAATVFNRSQNCIFEKYAITEGMGSGILIKIARCSKSTKWVLSNAGETCALFENSNKAL